MLDAGGCGFEYVFLKCTINSSLDFRNSASDEFITCYKESAKELSASRMKDIVITHDKDNLNVRLFIDATSS